MTTIAKDGAIFYPTMENLYAFFAPRSKDITVWSYGFRAGGFESELMEKLGCRVSVFDKNDESFNVAKRVLTTHATEESDPSWANSLKSRYVITDRLTFSNNLPWSLDGAQDGFTTQKINTEVNPRLDICKVDMGNLDTHIVHTILDAGYRPGLFYIHWNEHPDSSTKTMLSAGHLQNCGYKLMSAIGNFFLYRFNDNCVYETCSWSRTDVSNPMLEAYREQLQQLNFNASK